MSASRWFACLLLFVTCGSVWAQSGAVVPRVLDYQGRLIPDAGSSLPASGSGWFKFALEDGNGDVVWTNDGSAVDLATPGSDEPAAAFALAVAGDGYFTTSLDLSAQNLLNGATLSSIGEGLKLHVWYGGDSTTAEETATFEKLVDGQTLRSVPFALRAGHADSATTALAANTATTATSATHALTADSATTATSAGSLSDASLTETMLSAELAAKISKLDSLDALATRLQAIEGAATPYYVTLPTVYLDSFYQVQVGETLSVPIEADYTSHMRIVSGPADIAFSNTSPFRLEWTPDVADIGQHNITVQAENVFSSTYSQVALSVIVAPDGMAYIPSGTFLMGRGDEGTSVEDPDQTPTRTVTLTSSFFMDEFETTQSDWDQTIYQIQADPTLGPLYSGFNTVTSPSVSQFPVTRKTWMEVVTWCNMLSELKGLTPAYYLNDSYTEVLRDATIDVTNADVYLNEAANGYRLPTEAEWEYAARGGLVQQKYPWGDQVPNEALVNGANFNTYVVPKNETLYPAFGYGLYHMSGNVREWVWDWYDSNYYSQASSVTNPTGPTLQGAENTAAFGKSKVVRSNYFSAAVDYLSVYYRDYREPSRNDPDIGFRCLRIAEIQ